MFHLFKKKSKTPTSQTNQTKNDLLTFSQSLHPQIPSDETRAIQTFQSQTTNTSPKDLKNQRLSRYLQSDSFSSSGSSFDHDDIEPQSGADYDEFYLKFSDNKEADVRMANTDRGTYYKREHILNKEEQNSIAKQNGSDKVSYPDVYIYNMCNNNQPKSEDKKVDLRSSRRSFSNIEEVESLKIGFKKCRKFSPQQLADLANRISSGSTDLKMISLEFKNCPDLSNHDLANLGASLGVGKKSMEYLSLVFVKCERISEQGILSLINGLFSDLSMIKGLRLRLRGCKEINDPTAHSLIARLCVELANLDDLIVDFDACGGVTQTGIRNLSQQISAKDCIVQLSHCGITFYKWWWAPDNGDQEAEAYIRRRLAKSGGRGVMFKLGKINCSVNRIISSNFEDNALPIWSAEIENSLTKEKQSSRKTSGKDLRKMKNVPGIAEFNQTAILA